MATEKNTNPSQNNLLKKFNNLQKELENTKPSNSNGQTTSPITNLQGALQHVDYRIWFTNAMAKEYMNSLSIRLKESSETEKKAALVESAMAVTVYSFLIYQLYPKKSELRKAIIQDPELSSNFVAMKSMLDKSEGKKAAEVFLNSVIGNSQGENNR
jgi:hypothetical protein